MQEVSDWEERVMCPNSYSPHNWYQCGNSGEVIHANAGGARLPLPFKRSNAFRTGVESCLSDETKIYAKTNIQPLHLKCTDPEFCLEQEDYIYFVRNTTEWGDRMHTMCLFEYNSANETSSEICLPPMLLEKVAYIFSPVDDEVLPNDPDACGFYFMPYEAERQYINRFEGFYVSSFDIEWHPQSYYANHQDYPDVDYAEVLKSTRKQNQYTFDGPFPFAHVVADNDGDAQ